MFISYKIAKLKYCIESRVNSVNFRCVDEQLSRYKWQYVIFIKILTYVYVLYFYLHVH